MIDISALRGAIIAAGHTVDTVAKTMGIPRSTFYEKLKNADFTINEAAEMVMLLGIKHPEEIFILREEK